MPGRFILLDHSLKRAGGHHFDYDTLVLRAAADMGHELALVTHKRFRGNPALPPACRVLPLFPRDAYNAYTIFFGKRHGFAAAGAAQAGRSGLGKFSGRARRWFTDLRHGRATERRIRDFADACRQAFWKLGSRAGDLVFLPTVSELDFEGLARYLQSEPASRDADWHVQFHFNIFDGREPDYPRQAEKLAWLRRHLAGSLARIPGHRLHFFNTSDTLTRQYNLLGLAHFEELPYPINASFHLQRIQQLDPSKPLRITCAGGVREEKGPQGLGSLVGDLWRGCLDEGRAQLFVQAKRARLSGRPRHPIALPVPNGQAPRTCLPSQECEDPVVYIRHPLGASDYEMLVRRADIGLFLYDSAVYYSRRAGVLGEMLAAGVPVVVPAGCWLAEQIAEPNYRHAAQMAAQLACVGGWAASQVTWQGDEHDGQPLRQGHVLRLSGAMASSCTFAVPGDCTELAIDFDWLQPLGQGTYLKLVLELFGQDGVSLSRSKSILGRREESGHQVTLMRCPAGARSGQLSLSNAFDAGEISICDLQMKFLDSTGCRQGNSPLGAVGLVAADSGEVARLLREIIQHHEHYRNSAGAFSVGWFSRHQARLTVQSLFDRSRKRELQPPLG